MSDANDPRLLRLNAADNVLTVISVLNEGDQVQIGGDTVTIAKRLALGHKIASRPIERGEKVVKYGAPIGSAHEPIAKGEHVHTHNLKSDYLPTYLREDQGRLFAEQHKQSQHQQQ